MCGGSFSGQAKGGLVFGSNSVISHCSGNVTSNIHIKGDDENCEPRA